MPRPGAGAAAGGRAFLSPLLSCQVQPAAALARIAGLHRWQILLKSLDAGPLHRFVERLLAEHPGSFNSRQVRVVVDVDPLFLM